MERAKYTTCVSKNPCGGYALPGGGSTAHREHMTNLLPQFTPCDLRLLTDDPDHFKTVRTSVLCTSVRCGRFGIEAAEGRLTSKIDWLERNKTAEMKEDGVPIETRHNPAPFMQYAPFRQYFFFRRVVCTHPQTL